MKLPMRLWPSVQTARATAAPPNNQLANGMRPCRMADAAIANCHPSKPNCSATSTLPASFRLLELDSIMELIIRCASVLVTVVRIGKMLVLVRQWRVRVDVPMWLASGYITGMRMVMVFVMQVLMVVLQWIMHMEVLVALGQV